MALKRNSFIVGMVFLIKIIVKHKSIKGFKEIGRLQNYALKNW